MSEFCCRICSVREGKATILLRSLPRHPLQASGPRGGARREGRWWGPQLHAQAKPCSQRGSLTLTAEPSGRSPERAVGGKSPQNPQRQQAAPQHSLGPVRMRQWLCGPRSPGLLWSGRHGDWHMGSQHSKRGHPSWPRGRAPWPSGHSGP